MLSYKYLAIRRLVESTDQAYSSGFYFRIEVQIFGPNFSHLIFEAVNFLDFCGPTEMRGNNFEENKVIPSIFMQIWSRSHLNKLDWLAPQDV